MLPEHSRSVAWDLQKGGNIPLVGIQSQLGGQCHLSNPWQGTDVTRKGRKAEDLSGETLTFQTTEGEIVIAVSKGSKPSQVKVP